MNSSLDYSYKNIIHVAEVDKVVEKGRLEGLYSAAAVIALSQGRVFHRAFYGCLASFKSPKVDEQTLFDLGSLSKPLGAGLAALYLSKNRLDISKSVIQSMPGWPKDFEQITLDMLLDHSSGLASAPPWHQQLQLKDGKIYLKDKLFHTQDVIDFFKNNIAKMPLAYKPGSQTFYSDLNFMLLGFILEHGLKKPLDEFLEQTLYRPLGLEKDIFFVRLQPSKKPFAKVNRSFVATEQCPWRQQLMQGQAQDPLCWAMGGVAGHAGLFATADATAALAQVLLESFHGQNTLFHPALVARFWTRSKRVAQGLKTLGWTTPCSLSPLPGKRFAATSVGHHSKTGTCLWIDPGKKLLGVVLTNSAHVRPEEKKVPMMKLLGRVYDLLAAHAQDFDKHSNHSLASKKAKR